MFTILTYQSHVLGYSYLIMETEREDSISEGNALYRSAVQSQYTYLLVSYLT